MKRPRKPKALSEDERPLGIREAARNTEVALSTLQRWIAAGKITRPLTLAKIAAVQRRVVNNPPLAKAAKQLDVSAAMVLIWQQQGLLPRPLTPDAVEAFRLARLAQAAADVTEEPAQEPQP